MLGLERPMIGDEMPTTCLPELLQRLDRIEATLTHLVEQRTIQDWYDIAAVAKILGRSKYQVREWCRLRRVRAEKRACGRGHAKEWMLSHEEVMRIKSHGLLPLPDRP